MLIEKLKLYKYQIILVFGFLVLIYLLYPVVGRLISRNAVDEVKISLEKEKAQLKITMDSIKVKYDSSIVVTKQLKNKVNNVKEKIVYRNKYLYIDSADELEKLLTNYLDSAEANQSKY